MAKLGRSSLRKMSYNKEQVLIRRDLTAAA
jgi:hypothetical protein